MAKMGNGTEGKQKLGWGEMPESTEPRSTGCQGEAQSAGSRAPLCSASPKREGMLEPGPAQGASPRAVVHLPKHFSLYLVLVGRFTAAEGWQHSLRKRGRKVELR